MKVRVLASGKWERYKPDPEVKKISEFFKILKRISMVVFRDNIKHYCKA